MIPLKKLLKPKLLRTFLAKALEMLNDECSVSLFCDGEQLIAVGSAPHPTAPDAPGVIHAPVRLGDGRRGALAVMPRRGEDISQEQRESIRKILEFSAFALQGFIELDSARRSIADETLSKYRELAMQHRAIVEFNNSLRLRDVTRALVKECQVGAIPAEMGIVLLADEAGEAFRPADSFGDISLDALQDSPLTAETAKKNRGEILNDLPNDARWRGEAPAVRSLLLQPIAAPNLKVGVIALASTKPNAFDSVHLKHLSTLASVAGIAMSNAFNFEGVKDLMDALLQALAEAIDARDPFTAGHSRRVAYLCSAFAIVLDRDQNGHKDVRFSPEQIGELYYAGILHDVGKIGIREEVLTKETRLPTRLLEIIRARLELYAVVTNEPWEHAFSRLEVLNRSMHPDPEDLEVVRELSGRTCCIQGKRFALLKPDEQKSLMLGYGNLTPDERREIERHPAESHRILQHIPFKENYRDLRTIVRQHHERLDGSGYPDGLKGDDILIQSRMMAIVDIYDAVTQDRHYKPAFSREDAISILNKEASQGKLDAGLLSTFVNNLDHIEHLSRIIEKDRRWDVD
ncbi:MAG: HD-GYP domain-containing protein [Desulfovibrionaceae bacterium]|jgi:HD-GYP domain-containing protein (c-di-GMP phosphodiesterase class II)